VDLEREFLNALDDPSDVWTAVVNNLSPGPRALLLVFTTCTTPLSMVAWQAAVARVSTDAAVKFEASLRALDDSFISISRPPRGGEDVADFRNPSIDDFCADYLDQNIGIAVKIASKRPSVSQIRRLIKLSTARRGGVLVHRSLNRVLVAEPQLLVECLLELLPDSPGDQMEDRDVAIELVRFVGHAGIGGALLARVQAALGEFIGMLIFGDHDYLLFSLLDDRMSSRGLRLLAGEAFGGLYARLWQSADSPPHFDSMLNLDKALGIQGRRVPWRDSFIEMSERWLEDEHMSTDDIASTRDYYSAIAEHLDLGEYDQSAEWDEAVQLSELADRESARRDDKDDESWAQSDYEDGDPQPSRLPQTDPVDTLFDGLRSTIGGAEGTERAPG
jgi:hypothetical protein